jgi:hypothetical protein
MFKNLQSGAQQTTGASGGDSKIRVDVSIFTGCYLTDLNREIIFHQKKGFSMAR